MIDVHYASLTSQGVQHRVFYLDGHPSRYQPRLTGLNFGEQTGTGVFPLVIAVLHYWLHYGRKLTSYHYQLTYFTLSWSRFHLNFYLQFCCSHFTKHSPFILRFIPCVLEVESCTVLDQTRPLSHGT